MMPRDPKHVLSSKKVAQLAISIYDLMSQLQWTPTQIPIFELLELSPLHKEILEKSLCTTNVSTTIHAEKFQAMVNHISSHFLKRMKKPRELQIMIQIWNIWQLGISKFVINPGWKITIKAYDEFEWSSKGLIMLPICVEPIEKDVVFQVLNIHPAYNILLVRSCIHDMHFVQLMYHKYIKFPFNGVEIMILGDNSMCINMLAII